MRTTLDIDDTILTAAKKMAQVSGCTPGAVLSKWARMGLRQDRKPDKGLAAAFPVFVVPRGAKPLTAKTVARIVNHEGISTRR